MDHIKQYLEHTDIEFEKVPTVERHKQLRILGATRAISSIANQLEKDGSVVCHSIAGGSACIGKPELHLYTLYIAYITDPDKPPSGGEKETK